MKAGEKPQASLSLVQAETTQQLGMFESGVLHASLKPIVKAKVNKVISFIHKTKESLIFPCYNQGFLYFSLLKWPVAYGNVTEGIYIHK